MASGEVEGKLLFHSVQFRDAKEVGGRQLPAAALPGPLPHPQFPLPLAQALTLGLRTRFSPSLCHGLRPGSDSGVTRPARCVSSRSLGHSGWWKAAAVKPL